ncbi:MAG TPA: IS3 family transposase [Polyangiales bacterium]
MELLRTRDVEIPFRAACEVLGMPRATARRRLGPRYYGPRRPRPTSHRKLAECEEQAVLAVLHSERFQDQAPRQVYAELLDEGTYLASPSTMYRILAAHGESGERRNQREARSHAVPRLEATRPNQVWTWDVSKLATYVPGVFLNLYLVLDLFSRYPVAWMIAERENSALSKQLFAQAITRYKLEPGTITVHNDRGAPMTASGFVDMLAQLGVEHSKSRPRVSNDNPFSESCFKTIKYQPDYPGRFQGLAHARRWFVEFFDWYANRHRHSGLALFTPADVFFGRVAELANQRQRALDAAYAAHAERFVRGRPIVRLPPAKVAINPIDPGAVTQTVEDALHAPTDVTSLRPSASPLECTPTLVLPGISSAARLLSTDCS